MARNSRFVNSLIRGFASQIGRDSAKVITNGVYGNAHATPYRSAGTAEVEVDLTKHYQKLTAEDLAKLNLTNIREWCEAYSCSYVHKGRNLSWGENIAICAVWLFFLGPIGSFVVFCKGMSRLFSKKLNHERYEIAHPYIEEYSVIDNRTKTGFRTNRRKNVEYFELCAPDSQEKYISRKRKIGAMNLILAICSLIFWFGILPKLASTTDGSESVNTTQPVVENVDSEAR